MLKISKISLLIAGLFLLAFNVHAQVTGPVTTLSVTGFSSNSAIGGGLTTLNQSIIKEVGLCWNTEANPNPTVDGPKVVCTGFPNFSGEMTNLVSTMVYYVRAYVITTKGDKVYGKSVRFIAGLPKD